MIKSQEISVVVQGAISKDFTKKTLNSIRNTLPDAEIILSTWKGSKVDGLNYDVLVENEDPGSVVFFPKLDQYYNLNRQIVSTKGGLAKASRKYILKTRSDIELKRAGFLEFFDKFSARNENIKILKKRVITCNYYAEKPDYMPFHIGDWVFFGLAADVKNIWEIPLAPELEITTWFESHPLTPQHQDQSHPLHFYRHRFSAEQYVWSQFLRKYTKLNFDHIFDISPENCEITNLSFANNVVIISPKQYGIRFLKRYLANEEKTMYNFYDWQFLYKKYCDHDYQIQHFFDINSTKKGNKYLGKINRDLHNLSTPKRNIVRRAISILLNSVMLAIYAVPYFLNRKPPISR